jgi:hypothetical protein
MSIRRVTAAAGAALALAVAPAVAADLRPAPGVAIEDPCPSGRAGCVDRVIREMRTRLRPLLRGCHHDAVFALVYLRVTEEYRRTLVADPDVFADPAYVNREDAAFAAMYFSARDAHLAGRPAPPAWRVAFEASRTRSVTGVGDLLLAMNAHINRDLPFVLAALGLRRPDGTSRKSDHDAVNAILHRAYGPALDEVAARLDPSIDDADLPTGIDDEVLFQLVVAWREAAWRNAQVLRAAPSGTARALVAASIEAGAAATARSIRLSTAYLPPLTSPAGRDAYCASAG